jgi:predicted PurR-regulated permease PerM
MTGEIVRFGQKVFAAVLIIGLVLVVAYSIQVLLLVFAGILLTIFLRSAGMWISDHTRLPIIWCMAIVLISFVGIFFGSVWMFGVQIADKADQLFWAVSQAYTQIRQKLAQYHMSGGLSVGGINLERPARAAALERCGRSPRW